VYKAKYLSPLNLPSRTGDPQESWGRYDVTGHATLYGASSRRGALVEVLSYFAQLTPTAIPVHEMFSDVAPGEKPIEQDWAAMRVMPPGDIAGQFRRDRLLAEVVVTRDGHVVDVSAAETLGTLRRSAEDWVPTRYLSDISRIDLASLTGSDRLFTCAAAAWLSQRILNNGSVPLGVTYQSRHGGDLPCWAVWVPVLDNDVQTAVTHYAERVRETPIDAFDSDLRWAARQLGLRYVR
jgi:hypothetical protein